MHDKVRKNDKVETTDGRYLGTAFSLHYRQDEVNPELELYAVYLKTWNEQMGDWFFLPTDFIQSADRETNTIKLSVDFATVQKETWSRLPDFIARAHDKEVELPTR
jgi:hypothetical protein